MQRIVRSSGRSISCSAQLSLRNRRVDLVRLGHSGKLSGLDGLVGGVGRGGLASAAEIALSHGRVLASVLLDRLSGLASVLGGDLAELGRLVVGYGTGVIKQAINGLLVGGIDEWEAEEGRDADQGQTPEGNDLDETVGDGGGKECGDGDKNIFGEQNALCLDDEEVDQLLDVAQHTLQRLARDGVIFARAHASAETMVEQGLSSNLERRRDRESVCRELKQIADDVQVTGQEDEGDHGEVSDSGCARILPLCMSALVMFACVKGS